MKSLYWQSFWIGRKVDKKDPRHLPSIPKQNQPEPTEKKNSVIQSQSGIIRNPLARKVKTEPKPDKDNQYVNEDSNKTEPEVNKVVLKQESLIQPENNEIIENIKIIGNNEIIALGLD